MMGTLPPEIEVNLFLVNEHECMLCGSGQVESECPDCCFYDLRFNFFGVNTNSNLTPLEKFKFMLSDAKNTC